MSAVAHIQSSFRCACSPTTSALTRSLLAPCLRQSKVVAPRLSRGYATHRDAAPSSLLTSALEQKQRTSSLNREDSIGPFQLGISQASLQRAEQVKKWSELTTGGKVVRTTQRATNLTVILLGAGLSAVLLYALTSELFSKNSPTVIYNDACERIKVSNRVSKYLHGPLTFHNSPPSAVRPRHRNRHVASHVAVDSSGREHMLLNFYVKGLPTSSPSPSSPNNETTRSDLLEELKSISFDDVKAKVVLIVTSAKRAFRYLSGDVVPSPTPPVVTEEANKEREDKERSLWGITGLFSGLRGRRPQSEGRGDVGMAWTEGEVHADLVRNDEGYFVFRYLLIDIPNSESRNPIRVFVERAPGVRENEPIMRFHSS
ncbi:TIM21-domain-containing protein [Phlebopus sp. FC_14]|nr:TIM21-domain-containing protein [Phlebopus sp. FC_14]